MSRGCIFGATVCYFWARCTGRDLYGRHMTVAFGLRCSILEVGVQVGTCMDVIWV